MGAALAEPERSLAEPHRFRSRGFRSNYFARMLIRMEGKQRVRFGAIFGVASDLTRAQERSGRDQQSPRRATHRGRQLSLPNRKAWKARKPIPRRQRGR